MPVFHLGKSASIAWCFNDGVTVLSRQVGGGAIAPRRTVAECVAPTDNYIYTTSQTKAVPST